MSGLIAHSLQDEALPPVAMDEWWLEGCLGEASDLTRVRVQKSPFIVGRSVAADFRLPSKNVSKQHAELLLAGEAVFVRDMNSSNGTFLNGRRLECPMPVGENDLLQFADMEFRLKRSIVEPVDHTAVASRPEEGWLISRLQQVLSLRRFDMAFQPIVRAETGQTMGFEALVRCTVPGLESPAQLFRAAERLGLEQRLSQLCREAAVAALRSHPGREDLFINTHPKELLGPELLESLRLLRDQLGPRRLVVEIHEASVPDLQSMRTFSDGLKELGIGLAYDDFGAGQSRLLELAEAPPDYLKFDRSLLVGLREASQSHYALLRTLLLMAWDNGIVALAEGLDDRETVEICRQLGFALFQGYFFGRPAPLD